MQNLSDFIDHLHMGDPTTFESLTIFPVFSDQLREKDYLTLDEALEQGKARVVEVSEQGQIPHLLFENMGDKKVLLVDGDELLGAKQNRIINLTILAPANETIEIPVSCVEAGRWSRQSEEFVAAGRAMFSPARAAKAQQVTAHLKRSGERYSNQHEVWDDIAACRSSLDVPSATGAMSDIYESYEKRLYRYKRAFKAQQGQVGALFAVRGKVQGLEIFDSAQTFSQYLERLVSSYALSSLSDNGKVEFTAVPDTRAFMENVKHASAERFDALGEGDDLRLSGDAIAGGALVAEERIVHLAAFDTHSANRRGGSSPRGYRNRSVH